MTFSLLLSTDLQLSLIDHPAESFAVGLPFCRRSAWRDLAATRHAGQDLLEIMRHRRRPSLLAHCREPLDNHRYQLIPRPISTISTLLGSDYLTHDLFFPISTDFLRSSSFSPRQHFAQIHLDTDSVCWVLPQYPSPCIQKQDTILGRHWTMKSTGK
ncbi:hypothetical protein BKA80DRAFT_127849 [Phyllosticta citrichinensis]